MADDERRAEIEAVARALAYNELGRESGWSAYRRQAATVLRYLNRVRDARGDDEGEPPCDCQWRISQGYGHRLDCPMLVAHKEREAKRKAARSPQGEDHKHRKTWEMTEDEREAVAAPFVAPPSRDGTVAVEEVAKLVEALRRIVDLGPYSTKPRYIAQDALAEFTSPASTRRRSADG